MGPFDLLRLLVRTLEVLHLDNLVTGSMATIAYGEPRLTNDRPHPEGRGPASGPLRPPAWPSARRQRRSAVHAPASASGTALPAWRAVLP